MIRIGVALWLAAAFSGENALAQRHQKIVTPGSPEELMLERIEGADGQDRIDQIQAFLAQNPKHPVLPWLLYLMQQTLLDEQKFAESIRVGERLLERFPDDLDTALNCQKAAEQLKDGALIAAWKPRVDKIAKQIEANGLKDVPATEAIRIRSLAHIVSDNASNAAAHKAYQAVVSADSTKALEDVLATDKDPGRLFSAHVRLMQMYRDQGNPGKALWNAEELLKKDPDFPEALLTKAQIHLDRRNNYPIVFACARRALDVLGSGKKPEHIPSDQWQRVKSSQMGSAYLIIGNAHVSLNDFANADRSLRAALPYFRGSDMAASSILFFIGWSNYYLEKYSEAAKFFEECIKRGGSYGAQASRQLNGMKSEGRLPNKDF